MSRTARLQRTLGCSDLLLHPANPRVRPKNEQGRVLHVYGELPTHGPPHQSREAAARTGSDSAARGGNTGGGGACAPPTTLATPGMRELVPQGPPIDGTTLCVSYPSDSAIAVVLRGGTPRA